MRIRLLATLAGVTTAAALIASPTAAFAKASVERAGPFTTVVPVAFVDTNLAGVELMFADCDYVQRVVKRDGSSVETQHCQLTDPFFEFGGTPPERALTDTAGECTWFSDYYLTTLPEGVESDPPTAERARLTVTPSGMVNVTTFYPPNPKTEDECGDEGPGNVAG